MTFKVNRYKMSNQDAQKITDAIYYGARAVGQTLYKFVRSIYDEDAGVFTDYGQNDPNRTWSQIHFVNLCANAILNVKWGKEATDPAEIDILDISIPALVQLIFTLWSNPDLQKTIWESRAEDLWESDGHYGRQTRQEFTKSIVVHWGFDRKDGRRICELLQGSKMTLQGELVIGKSPREIR